MKALRFLILAGLFFAAPSFAATGWYANAACTGDLITVLPSNGVAYYCVDSATPLSFSPPLSTKGYRLDAQLTRDTTQSAAGSCSLRLWHAVRGTPASSTGLGQIVGDTDGDGNQNLGDVLNNSANKVGVYDFSAVAISVETVTAAAGSEQCVLTVTGASR
jgi:hypothetical protein